MRALCQRSGYTLDAINNIWIKPAYEGIAYNDGDEIEKRIASIIQNASDLSVLSSELRRQCTDWPSLYHLSGTRANIMRPFETTLKGDILEIGAGCGAITRYLGECGANVLALEGSPRRAAIARSRTRDLGNVTVLAERFDRFQCDRRFDVITLIGVLEYANLFTSDKNAPIAMLERVRSLLKPEGKLIIAIENQLGLKYFAGAPEDHLGQPMIGIEGRYREDQPKTFGRAILANMLEQAGFIKSEFLAPFPDYKLPVSILTENGINSKDFGASAFAWQSVRRDPQLPIYCNFSLELAWPEVFQNELSLDLANSFLIIASPNTKDLIDARVLAYHYATDRVAKYCKETVFTRTEDKGIFVHYRPFFKANENTDNANNPLIRFTCPDTSKYVLGQPLSREFVRLITKDRWSFDQLGQLILRYLSIVETFANTDGIQMNMTLPYAKLSGDFFDAVPQNIIVREDGGSPVLIDKEWQFARPIEIGFLLFRSLILLVTSVTRFARSSSGENITYYQFISGAFAAAGLGVQDEDYARYISLEAEIQQTVAGHEGKGLFTWWKEHLPMSNLSQAIAEHDRRIVDLNQAIAERDTQIASLTEELVRRGEWALRLDAELQEERAKLQSILQSNSWRMTKPFRESRRWISTPRQQAKRYTASALRLAKRLYQALPINAQTRAIHRNLLARHFPRALLLSGSPNDTIPVLSIHTPNLISIHTVPSARSIRVRTHENPVVSVIIPIYGKVDYTLRCLASIAAHAPQTAYEVIVVDDGSPDNSAELLVQVDGIRLISNGENQGFIRSCNLGAKAAKGEYLLFLNNDTQVTAGWLEELLRSFDEFPGTGLAGSKLIYPDGRLQEAGGIIWQDGSAWNFGRFQNPSLPVYNYAREVDYCSGASIMVPKVLFEELDGFDEHYLPAYCEDSDLALKIRDKGYRVIYQPLSTVIHYEGITSGTDTSQGTKAYQIVNSKKLYERWKSRLQKHQPPGIDVDNAKDRCAAQRVLFLDHCVSTPDQDAGSVTAFNSMLLLREMGFQVTFIPEDNFLYVPKYTGALQRAGIEVLYAPYVTSVEQHLKEYGDRYTLAVLFRPLVVERHAQSIRKHSPKAKILYHTMDLHFLRMSREAELQADKIKQKAADKMKQRELAAIRAVDASIVHSTAELELLWPMLPDASLHVFPLILDVKGSDRPFNERKDIVFVGGYQHSPNVDAVKYFTSEIMPLLRRRLPGVRFYAVGSNPPPEIKALESEDIIITGFVEELTPLLGKMRVSVAPLRYGAGIKGKIGTAMAVGLPVVATPLAAEGMSLIDGENVLVADGVDAFADAVCRLYQDDKLWNRLCQNGLDFAERSWGAEAAWNIFSRILNELDIQTFRGRHPLSLYCEWKVPKYTGITRLSPIVSAVTRQEFEKALTNRILDPIVKVENDLIDSHSNGTFTVDGYCVPCEKQVSFLVDMQWGGQRLGHRLVPNWRERLECPLCHMNNRQRLIATLIKQLLDGNHGWRVYFTEQVTPIFNWANNTFKDHMIVGSEYLGHEYESGAVVKGIRHEDIENLSFQDEYFDLIISNDVFEHIPSPKSGFVECARTLKPSGVMLATIPFHCEKDQSVTRARLVEGKLEHLLPPAYHGNPVSSDGSLVFTDFGWDVVETMKESGFSSVQIHVYGDAAHGHLGGGQLVFRLEK